jgi:gamma-glutamyltranspeptidase/glutathione hydrolase
MSSPERVARSRFGMAATAHPLATGAAVEVLERGGNAIDAAVAAALALGVCEPNASGLGGQTMMLIHLAG